MVAVSLSLSLLALPSARAANQYWTNLVDGNYTNGGNWNAAAPAIADAAFFTNAGVVYTATVDSSVTNANLTFSGNGATVVLNATGNNLWSTNRLVIGAGSAGNNSTLVLSGGSLWVTNAAGGTTVIGTNANTLGTMVISNGAFATSNLLLGGAGGSKGTLQVFGGSSTVLGTLTLGGVSGSTGTVLVAGGSFNPGTMVLGSVAGSIGNSLTVRDGGNLTSSGTGFMKVGNAVGSSNNLLVISGTGSTGSFVSASDFAVGYQGSYNSLVVSNGGYLNTPTNVTVGWANTIVGNNSALVAGSGSVWRTATLNIGGAYNGGTGQGNSSNALVIADGGTVLSFRSEGNQGFGAVIGYGAGPQGASIQNAYTNSVVVTGTGSLWNVSGGYLVVGLGGSRNSLVITNGGAVISASASASSIGGQTGGSNNWVLVTGAGSVWTNTGVFLGGAPDTPSGAGFGNSLTVAQGGKVISGSAASFVGRAANASSNTVTVTDTNSTWSLGSTLTVGNSAGANFNGLLITNGGMVSDTGATIGNAAGANSNWVFVAGASWTNNGTLMVGSAGLGNRMTISNGGFVMNTGLGYVGVNAGASNSLAIVTGNSSLWTNGSSLYVGQSGYSNVLMILAGGRVVNGTGVIGKGSSSTNNIVVVAGSGSLWNNTATILVGGDTTASTAQTPSFNQLVITNGGQVSTVGNGNTIGNNSNANYNSVLVGGANSLWTNTGTVLVGNFGAGNSLVITNGGRVVNTTGQVGASAAGTNNQVVVTGPGSIWVATSGVNVGSNATTLGSGRVLVTDGGTLQAAPLTAGFGGTGVITNSGGTFQFTSVTPTITPNGYGNIVATNGTISFLGVAGADVWGSYGSNALGNILYQGNNTFRLNAASNWSAASPQSYTFNTGISPSNYVGLEMINGGTAWKSAWLNLGTGGTLLVSNTTANLYGVVTNAGTITVAGAGATWASNVVLAGGVFRAVSGTNTFNNNLTVLPGASFSLDAGSTYSISGIFSNCGSATFSTLYTVGSGSVYQGLAGATNSFGGGLYIAAGASLLANNGGTTVVGGSVTNAGTIGVTNGQVVFQNAVVNLGAYVSDPSTNTFNGSYTVGPTGVVSVASNDVYAFGADFVLQSTNRAFNMSQAHVVFSTNDYGLSTTAASHTLNLAGSGAYDKGSNWLNVAQLATNFSIGTLTLASNNTLTVTGTRSGGTTNALYVGWLDLQAVEGYSTNNMTGLTNALIVALSLPDINLYYEKYNLNNAYLGGLEYNLWGSGGLLIPIPEPSPILAFGTGLVVLAYLRRRKA